jgi:hypothetical protein
MVEIVSNFLKNSGKIIRSFIHTNACAYNSEELVRITKIIYFIYQY